MGAGVGVCVGDCVGVGDGGGEGDEGITVGDGELDGGGGEVLGSVQLTGIIVAPPGPIVIVPCPEVFCARVMSTVTTTCWPASMVPPPLLSAMSDDDVTADQVTGPPLAVSLSWPVEPAPRSRRPGETCS